MVVTDSIQHNANSDIVVNSMYNYLDHCIQPTFKKKYMRSATNKFPANSWYEFACTFARKAATILLKLMTLQTQQKTWSTRTW